MNKQEEMKLVIKYLKREFGNCRKPYDKICAGCWATQLREALEWCYKEDYPTSKPAQGKSVPLKP